MKREETASAPSAPDDVWDAIACPGLKFFVFGFFPFSFLIAVLLRDACRVLFHFQVRFPPSFPPFPSLHVLRSSSLAIDPCTIRQLGILLFAVAFVLWDRAEFGGVHQWKKAALVVLSLVLVVYCVHGFFLIRTVSSLAKLDREYGLGSPSPLASLDAAMTLVAREDAADAGRTRSGEETRFALPQEDVDYLVDVRTSAARQPRIALWWYGDLQACNCTKQYLATVAKSQADPESVSMPAAHRDAAPSVPMPSAEAAAADVLHRRRMLRFLAWASIRSVCVRALRNLLPLIVGAAFTLLSLNLLLSASRTAW